jgi:3-hexulose-6-phosphate synthase
VARAGFERRGKAAPVQAVGGLRIPQVKSLAKAGLRAFAISGNMGLPDGNARYNLPPAGMQRLVDGLIAEVSGAWQPLDRSACAATGSASRRKKPASSG